MISTGPKVNPMDTLKAQAKEVDFNRLRVKKNDKSASSGEQAYKDINRMNFVINGKDIDLDFINQLHKKHTSLIESHKNGDKNYRPFAKKVFNEMFKYAEAEVPNICILEELITNCNQAGYESIYASFIAELYNQNELFMDVNGSNVDRKVHIDCSNPDFVKVKCKTSKAPVTLPGFSVEKICDISFSLKFTLEYQNGQGGIAYRNGKLSLSIPKELKNYQSNDKSLFDIIREYFQKLCEKLGFKFKIKTKIAHNLGDSVKVNDHLESVKPPICSNNHVLGH